jgi:hypothetical protein
MKMTKELWKKKWIVDLFQFNLYICNSNIKKTEGLEVKAQTFCFINYLYISV